MDYISIQGFKPYDGRYEFDLGGDLTTREWGWLKRLAGYRPAMIDEHAFSDPELVCVFALVALHRAGRVAASDVPDLFARLEDAPFGATIRMESDDEAEAESGDAGPPAPSLNANDAPSGGNGKTNSGISQPPPEPSGTTDLDSSASRPVTAWGT